MLKDQKILITGATSPVAQSLAKSLVANNEVWGAARFKDADTRSRLDAVGMKTIAIDVGTGNLSGLPTDFTHVLHLAYFRSTEPDFEQAYRVNGDGTGFVLSHCRKARAALYMSSHVAYSPPADPWYAQRETDSLGGTNPGFSATSAVSKLVGEGVARFCSREFNVPVTIARLNAPYAPMNGLLPTIHMDMIMAGKDVTVRWDPSPYSPIHTDDMCDQVEAMLGAASVPATIVNWAGDEIVTAQEWCSQVAELGGKTVKIKVHPVEGSHRGSVADTTKRKSFTGPCKIPFKEGFRRVFEARYNKDGTRRASAS
jgi:nucleoside-diphosphate-sugar epimerase